MRPLDAAVLMRQAGVVAARLHAVVEGERLIEPGQVLPGLAVEIAEGRREAVAAVLLRHAAERPERVLQPLGERDIALPAQHHMGMLEARVGQPEVVEPVIESLAGDADSELTHVGEVRKPQPPGLVPRAKNTPLLGAVQASPAAAPPLQGAADPGAEIGMT